MIWLALYLIPSAIFATRLRFGLRPHVLTPAAHAETMDQAASSPNRSITANVRRTRS